MVKFNAKQYHVILRRVLEQLDPLTRHLPDVHLASIAKAIESHSKDNRKIVFRAMPRSKFGKSDHYALTLTQEIRVHFPGTKKQSTLYEHFIYYPKISRRKGNGKEKKEVRFGVAHELGHILMHQPISRSNGRRYISLGGNGTGIYTVEYTEKQEKEADLFAAILCDQEVPSMWTLELRGPCIRVLAELDGMGFFRSDLIKTVSKISCTSII